MENINIKKFKEILKKLNGALAYKKYDSLKNPYDNINQPMILKIKTWEDLENKEIIISINDISRKFIIIEQSDKGRSFKLKHNNKIIKITKDAFSRAQCYEIESKNKVMGLHEYLDKFLNIYNLNIENVYFFTEKDKFDTLHKLIEEIEKLHLGDTKNKKKDLISKLKRLETIIEFLKQEHNIKTFYSCTGRPLKIPNEKNIKEHNDWKNKRKERNND